MQDYLKHEERKRQQDKRGGEDGEDGVHLLQNTAGKVKMSRSRRLLPAVQHRIV